MTITAPAREIFDDARHLYQSAIERLEAGDVRDAAEKAWCATLRATNALILTKTGQEPRRTPETSRLLDAIVSEDQRVAELVGRYYSRQTRLHGDCFYLGLPPTPDMERRIRETDQYIGDAESSAES